MRGFWIIKTPFLTIMVNIQDALAARTFTLLHELAHVIMGKEGVCDLGGHFDIEVSCNAIAGSALVPEKLLLAEPNFRTKSPHPNGQMTKSKTLQTDIRLAEKLSYVGCTPWVVSLWPFTKARALSTKKCG